ncbi:hypothetical protein K435DRAFT_654715 [Dendrothele bispora CBS 962.96]|uniref:Uncharacterized protein n=1 Tax=Dendrothele bispora (strain CBS 962.96) TaxID=1314807 RepID=A0A4V4HH89_DENBC|nr:hypothetical protein K435DRAFT_654715 [Dendrothele bispora CBS 962.96]
MPVLPFDIVQATWLVQVPDRTLSWAELIGERAKALALHTLEVDRIIESIEKKKIKDTLRYLDTHKAKVRNWNFKPGSLRLVRNTAIEKSLNRKLKPRFLWPCIVVRWTIGGSYVLAEMDGSVLQNKIAAFRVYPYHARRKIKLPDNLTGLTGLSEGELEEIINGPEPDDTPPVELGTEGTIEELPAEVPEDEGWSSTSEE